MGTFPFVPAAEPSLEMDDSTPAAKAPSSSEEFRLRPVLSHLDRRSTIGAGFDTEDRLCMRSTEPGRDAKKFFCDFTPRSV